MNNNKTPPSDTDAEEAVIGSLLIDSETMYKAAVLVEPDDFYSNKNRWAFEACKSLHKRNEAINQITVAQELDRQGRLEALGGAAYLSNLVTKVPTSLHIEYYADIVKRLAKMRSLIEASEEIAEIGYQASPDVDASLNQAEDILFQLRWGESTRDLVPIRSLLDEYFEDSGLAPHEEEAGVIPHIYTGFKDLDVMLGGLQRSDMVVLGARPSMGKSSFALNVARNAAVTQGAKVAMFSLEMSKEQLVHRFLSSEARIDSKRIRLGQHNDREEKALMKATGILAEAPIFIDDSSYPSTDDIESRSKRLQNEHGVNLIIVDYMQLIRPRDLRQNTVQAMTEISRSLKAIARDLNVPVLALSQLSRAVESRTTKTPQLSDLRESGGIEQDADVVMFIHREDYYINEDEWIKMKPTEQYPEGMADVIVAKHRNGPTGKMSLYFRKKYTKFENSTKEKPPLI